MALKVFPGIGWVGKALEGGWLLSVMNYTLTECQAVSRAGDLVANTLHDPDC